MSPAADTKRIEYEILRLVRDCSDDLGLPGDVTSLSAVIPGMRNAPNSHRKIVGALKRLNPKYLTIWKCTARRERLQYPTQIKDDIEVFNRPGTYLCPTEYTDPYIEELAEKLAAQLSKPEQQKGAREAVRMKEDRATLPAGKPADAGGLPLIADDRLAELRKLSSPDFDFWKLIRLCEELNSSYHGGNYFATAMLTRGLLDHVPPLLGKPSFAEVANNYGGAGKSFKEAMHHLENAARKIGDGHLHMAIRKRETLPTAQQVCFAPQIDVLLSEIVRILR